MWSKLGRRKRNRLPTLPRIDASGATAGYL